MKLLMVGLFCSLISSSYACIEYVEVAFDDGVKLEGITVNHQIVFKDKDSKNLDGMKLLNVVDYKTKKEVKNLFKLDFNVLSVIPIAPQKEKTSLSGFFELTLAGRDNVSKSLLLVVKKSSGEKANDALSNKSLTDALSTDALTFNSLTREAKSSGCGGKISIGKYTK